MADAYERVKGGRLTFKDGSVATRSKAIDKNKSKKKKKKIKNLENPNNGEEEASVILSAGEIDCEGGDGDGDGGVGGEVYTIDAAKRMKYEQLFPVEAKKFGYDPKNASSQSMSKCVEEALDDRVKKKADRYCK